MALIQPISLEITFINQQKTRLNSFYTIDKKINSYKIINLLLSLMSTKQWRLICQIKNQHLAGFYLIVVAFILTLQGEESYKLALFQYGQHVVNLEAIYSLCAPFHHSNVQYHSALTLTYVYLRAR